VLKSIADASQDTLDSYKEQLSTRSFLCAAAGVDLTKSPQFKRR